MATATAPPRRRTRLEHDERREQILRTARRLFRDRQYSSVSTSEIARESGVARGLLHHYFGAKRDLYLEVVRSMVRSPALIPPDLTDRPLADVLDESIDRWLEMVRRNRATWFAAIGAEGFGRDPEVEAILEHARDEVAARMIVALGYGTDPPAPPELHAVIRVFSGLGEAATREWLQRGRLSRAQTRIMLRELLLTMVGDVLDDVVADRQAPDRTTQNGKRPPK